MKTTRLFVYSLICRVLPETACARFRNGLLRWCGATIGHNVRIAASARIFGTGRLIIGNDVWIGSGVYLSATGNSTITIGSHIDFGPQCMVLTGSHKVEPEGEHIGGRGTSASVSIGDGCWLGARSVILPGVLLPGKTLVAAGTIVTKSIHESHCLLAGVPAEIKKKYK